MKAANIIIDKERPDSWAHHPGTASPTLWKFDTTAIYRKGRRLRINTDRLRRQFVIDGFRCHDGREIKRRLEVMAARQGIRTLLIHKVFKPPTDRQTKFIEQFNSRLRHGGFINGQGQEN